MDSSRTQLQEEQPTLHVQPEQPWLLTNGNATPEKYLRELTPNWDTETWERYLAWYEAPRSESLLPPRRYDQICEEATESIFVRAQSHADGDLRSRIGKYLATLTGQQRQVTELIFWHGRSERYVADKLGISQQSVHRLKQRSLKRIKHLLKEGVASRIMRGEVSSLSSETGDVNGKKVLDLAFGVFPQAG
jgi:RNA polymerase sigma factor (sigma-70 family)